MKFLFFCSLFIAVITTSCTPNNPSENQNDVEDSSNVNVPETLSTNKQFSDDDLKVRFAETIYNEFGKMAKITKWGECSRWTTVKSNALNITGELVASVRGDKATYTFIAFMGEDGSLQSLQMHHKGTNDCFYNYVEGHRLDDNTIKRDYTFKGIKLTIVNLGSHGIRYVTSRKMSKEQIVDFIVNETDIKLSNYYFQLSKDADEYAVYIGNEDKGSLIVYNKNSEILHTVTINDDGKFTITKI